MTEEMQIVDSVNQCQIEQMQRVGRTLDPERSDSCGVFSSHVRTVEAVIVFNYQLAAYATLREPSPKKAAEIWGNVVELCRSAINVLSEMKEVFPDCGTPELYNLTLDYCSEATKRRDQNLEDSEWANQIPAGLFPTKK